MNNLSWLIYLASLSDSASSFFSFLAFVSTVFAAVGLVLSLMWTDGASGFGNKELYLKGYEEMRKRGKALIPRGLLGILIFGGIAVVLPGKNTIYAIAASEIGERMVKSDQVQDIASDATKALQQWIKRQIEPDAEKKR